MELGSGMKLRTSKRRETVHSMMPGMLLLRSKNTSHHRVEFCGTSEFAWRRGFAESCGRGYCPTSSIAYIPVLTPLPGKSACKDRDIVALRTSKPVGNVDRKTMREEHVFWQELTCFSRSQLPCPPSKQRLPGKVSFNTAMFHTMTVAHIG